MAKNSALLRISIALGLALGLAGGIGIYTFVYADGASYLTNDPAVCANCHIMKDHFDAWGKSSHHAVAVCNDCHTPRNFFGKYLIKGLNGFRHSVAFTTQRFHEPIQITPLNRQVTETACRYCHEDVVHYIDRMHAPEKALSCIRCHASVGHQE